MKFGERIKTIRQLQGLTKSDVVKEIRLGGNNQTLDVNRLSNIEEGKTIPSKEQAKSLANFFNISWDRVNKDINFKKEEKKYTSKELVKKIKDKIPYAPNTARSYISKIYKKSGREREYVPEFGGYLYNESDVDFIVEKLNYIYRNKDNKTTLIDNKLNAYKEKFKTIDKKYRDLKDKYEKQHEKLEVLTSEVQNLRIEVKKKETNRRKGFLSKLFGCD